MKIKTTGRGFGIANFKDQKGIECSIQKSSIATDECIWFGANELEVSIGYPWTKISEAELMKKFGGQAIVGNTRMHLNRKQVAELLPILQKFVETGELN